MQKLRDLYKQTQRNTNDDFDKVTHDRMKKILAYANREHQNILDKQQFGLLDQIVFYQDRFREVVDTFDKAIQQGYKRPKIQTQLQVILKDNYAANGEYREENRPQPIVSHTTSKLPTKKPDDESQIAKEVIKSYFDNKNQEIQKSKIGFKSVLEDIPYAPKKFAVKPSQIRKVGDSLLNPSIINKDEINKYKNEVSKLKHELQNREAEKQFNMGLLQIQKKDYQQRIKQLSRKIQFLQSENSRLKEQSVKSYPIAAHQQFIPHQQPPLYNLINEEQPEQILDDYNPYTIKYRNNDLGKIKNKHLEKQASINQNQGYALKAYTYNHPFKQGFGNQKYAVNNFDILQQQSPKELSSRKNSEQFFNNSKVGKNDGLNDIKAIALKSKVSFFKPSMIIYRGSDVEIAVKSTDIVKLSSKKVVIYIQNKQISQKVVQLQYKADPNYYELSVKKKASVLQGSQQAREQIEVKLINLTDLDSLIEANLTIRSIEGTKQLQFLIPALFIQFIEKRPQINKGQTYTTERILPIRQFSSLHSSEELIPLQKLYGERYEAGRAYAISRSYEGYIFMRWIAGSIQIQTIPAFRLLMGYLLLREY